MQTQHPGIYYHKAAEYIGKRKEAYIECAAAAAAANASTTPLDNANASYANMFYSEFFGVRNSKMGDAITEQQVIFLVQANEKMFNHSVNVFRHIFKILFN